MKTEQSRIHITRGPTGYLSEVFGPTREYTIKLFGTAILPTAFTLQANIADVAKQIQALNPGTLVTHS